MGLRVVGTIPDGAVALCQMKPATAENASPGDAVQGITLAADTKFAAQIAKLFEDVSAKLFADEVRDKLVENIVLSVVNGLRARDY